MYLSIRVTHNLCSCKLHTQVVSIPRRVESGFLELYLCIFHVYTRACENCGFDERGLDMGSFVLRMRIKKKKKYMTCC